MKPVGVLFQEIKENGFSLILDCINGACIQINYADQDVDSNRLGKWSNQFHQYKLYSSVDGKKWNVLVDKAKTNRCAAWIRWTVSAGAARYIRLENIQMPTGKFAITVSGSLETKWRKTWYSKTIIALRTEKDTRSAWLKWSPVHNAFAYNIYYGTKKESCTTV